MIIRIERNLMYFYECIVICYYMDASTQSVENNYDYLKNSCI